MTSRSRKALTATRRLDRVICKRRADANAIMNATTQRNQSLDALRCIAVLLVVGFHLPYYRIWGTLGWIGVDLFFVLSGFLISGLLFPEYTTTGAIRLRRFLIRRGLKIYPAFYLLIGMAIAQSF